MAPRRQHREREHGGGAGHLGRLRDGTRGLRHGGDVGDPRIGKVAQDRHARHARAQDAEHRDHGIKRSVGKDEDAVLRLEPCRQGGRQPARGVIELGQGVLALQGHMGEAVRRVSDGCLQPGPDRARPR